MSQQVSFNLHPNFNPHKNTNPNASFNRHAATIPLAQDVICKVPLFTTAEPQLFADKLRDAQAELAVKSTMPTINPQWSISEQKYQQQRYEYYSQYIDLSKIDSRAQLIGLTSKIDFTGMSDIEKYTTIYDKYVWAFGEDFLKAGAVQYATMSATDIYGDITVRFYDDLRNVFGSTDKARQVYKEHLYGNMSDSEIRAEIAAKYPPQSRMSLKDYSFFLWEMNNVGVAGDLGNVWLYDLVADGRHSAGISTNKMDTMYLYDEFLNQRFDVGSLCRIYNSMLMAGSLTAKTGLLLQELFGVSLDGNGYAWS